MKRYTPDFPEMMRLCEMNFSQLRRLLPRNDAPGETVSYQVANAQYRLTIVESTRYTTPVSYTHLFTTPWWREERMIESSFAS